MRRDQTKTGSDYRRQHNQEMWDRPQARPVYVPAPWAWKLEEEGPIGQA